MKIVSTRRVSYSGRLRKGPVERSQSKAVAEKKVNETKKSSKISSTDILIATGLKTQSIKRSADGLTVPPYVTSGLDTQDREVAKLFSLINKSKAKKFWNIDRPYFFAIKKGQKNNPVIEEIEHLMKKYSGAGVFDDIDKKYDVYFSKSPVAKDVTRLIGINHLVNLGIFYNPLADFWTLEDEQNHDSDPAWPGGSRVSLAVLFRVKNGVIPQDIAYADAMVRNLSDQEFEEGMNTALYLASCSEVNERDPQFLRMLLKAGANPDADGGIYDNKSALGNAILRKAYPAVEELLKAGADPYYLEEPGEISGRDAAKKLNDRAMFQLLEKYGVRVFDEE